ncbi:MAG: SRPBCC domain-containing protein [Cyanobacteria bacterium P01_F01_bin.153]
MSISINASPETVWRLLTTAESYPEWNSTVISIKGKIELGNTVTLVSTLDPSREFKLKVKEFEPNQKLVWGDRQGSRVYTLEEKANSETLFSMVEKIGGILFPLYGKYIPPFDEAFEQFAVDLKAQAEARGQDQP